MKQVVITISKGIIQQVVFFDDPEMAIRALDRYVKHMNIEHDDAALYDSDGFIANARHFLDDHDNYRENEDLIKEVSRERKPSIYIIGNPEHRLGFMVASPDDPLGYDDPVAAVSELGQMRKDSGTHLKLYRVVPVDGPVTHRDLVEKYNADCGVDDFDSSLVKEYLDEKE